MRTIPSLAAFVLSLLALAAPGSAAGEDRQVCGGPDRARCADDSICDLPAGRCQEPDAVGTCVAPPGLCSPLGPKVCGCDGATYGNDCERLKLGIRKAHDGPCQAAPAPAACPAGGGCGEGRFCERPGCGEGAGKESGLCVARPAACIDVPVPVCGCDGKTYASDCARRAAGVSLRAAGACKPPTASR